MAARETPIMRHEVKLGAEERERLDTMIHGGKHPAQRLTRARILLKADTSEAGEGWNDTQIARALETSTDTVARTRRQLGEEGLDGALARKPSPNSARRQIFDGAAEAKLIALTRSKPPDGHARWTLRLLQEAVVETSIVDGASDNTIGRTLERVPITWNHVIEKDSLKIKELEHVLMRHRIYPMSKYRKSRATFSGHALKKNILKPRLGKQWVISPDANAAFVAAMEDVLEVHHRPHDPDRRVICLDEASKQLIAESRTPIAATPGHPVRYDHEYQRNGTANLFMMFAPLEGWRHVEVTDRHAAVDYARILKDLSDTRFPEATKIVLVQDNSPRAGGVQRAPLNTHRPASLHEAFLYEAFPAQEARRLNERFAWRSTPKHGSWLDMAESELGVLSTQCLDRRIPGKQTLTDEVAAWEARRNKHHAKADWQFTTADARVKLKRLYPVP